MSGDDNGGSARHRSPWHRRLAWFAGLWLAGIAVVSALAYLIRWLLAP